MTSEDEGDRKYSWICRIGLYLFNLLILVLCGVGFHYIESPNEKRIRDQYTNDLQFFLTNYTCVNETVLSNLINTILTANVHTNAEYTETNDTTSRWDIVNSIFLSTAIVTTVGYGSTPPATTAGRIFAIICALIGVPVFLICTAQAGIKINAYFGTITKKFVKQIANPTAKRFVRPVLIITAGLVVFVMLPSLLFVYTEGWQYGEAVYYCMVTMLTIGFGDFVPTLLYDSRENHAVKKSAYLVFICFWMVVGLIWMAMIISSIQIAVSHTSEKLDLKLAKRHLNSHPRCLMGGDDQEDDHKEPRIEESLLQSHMPSVSATSNERPAMRDQ